MTGTPPGDSGAAAARGGTGSHPAGAVEVRSPASAVEAGAGSPASGLLVLELASVLAGPSVGQFFAELGARVVKIENPHTGGDVTRSWRLSGEPPDGISAYFSACNVGKESVALALDRPEAQRVLHRLALRADAVIASFLPGQAERLGADAATLRALNPRLVYGSISGYGPDEPRAGYDAVLQAESGFLHMNGSPDGEPTKMPVALIDLMAAHQLKQAMLLALWHRERTGEGAVVDVSLYDAAISSLANQGTNYLVAGHDPERLGSEHPNIVPYGMTFRGSDGTRLLLAVGTDAQFAALVDLLGEPGLGSDERFRTNPARVRNREVLRPLLERLVAGRSAEDLLARLRTARIPAGAVRTVGEALRDPRSAAVVLGGRDFAGLRQAVFTVGDGSGGPGRTSLGPHGTGLRPPPALGEHTATVLEDQADVPAAELDRLRASGAAL